MLSSSKLKSLDDFTHSKARMRLEKSKLERLFTSMRPAYSNAEEEFVQKYILSPELVRKGMYQDGYGNCLLKIDNPDGTPSRTLWSCHTDSVHNRGGKQTVHFNPLDDKFSTPDGSCLGGDDNWSTGDNWGGGSPPGASNVAVFGSVFTSDSDINVTTTVAGIDIQSGYTGTLTLNSAIDITIGTSDFLQAEIPFSEREEKGLEAIIKEIFPIEAYDGTMSLDYLGYELGAPRYSAVECRRLRLTYGAPF